MAVICNWRLRGQHSWHVARFAAFALAIAFTAAGDNNERSSVDIDWNNLGEELLDRGGKLFDRVHAELFPQPTEKDEDSTMISLSIEEWLGYINMQNLAPLFVSRGLHSVQQLELHGVPPDDVATGFILQNETRHFLERVLHARKEMKRLLTSHKSSINAGRLIDFANKYNTDSKNQRYAYVNTVLTVLGSVIGFIIYCVPSLQRRHRNWSELLLQDYLDPVMCFIDDSGPSTASADGVIGKTESFTVVHVKRNGKYHTCVESDKFEVKVEGPGYQRLRTSVVTVGPERTVSYTTRVAGRYHVVVKVLGEVVCDFHRELVAGPVDPTRCKIHVVHHTMKVAQPVSVKIHCIDSYGNATTPRNGDTFRMRLCRAGEFASVETSYLEDVYANSIVEVENNSVFLHFVVREAGVFKGVVVFVAGTPDNTEDDSATRRQAHVLREYALTVVVLAVSDYEEMEHNCHANQGKYDAVVVSSGAHAGKKVTVTIQPTQLSVKTLWWKFLPWKILSVRVVPSTDVLLFDGPTAVQDASIALQSRQQRGDIVLPKSDRSTSDAALFLLNDRSSQEALVLQSSSRNLIYAIFCRFLKDRVGGSYSFDKKVAYFKEQLVQKHTHINSDFASAVRVPVYRARGFKLVEHVMSVTRRFSGSDWGRKWRVEFRGEPGMDYGGLTKELLQHLGEALFDPANHLFGVLDREAGAQGLVHPNPHPPSHINSDHWRFAGRVLGKCLVETAAGRNVGVPARFTRSFLAALLGLRASPEFFETDDPEYYRRKIKYIVENEVDDLEMTFTEEVYDDAGMLVREDDLKTNGRRTLVTDANKSEYLHALAYYKLEKPVQDSVREFLRGLHDLVPDVCVSIFDELELELLICGEKDYSAADMQAHARINGVVTPDFQQTLDWFWITVDSLTPEERRRLLQFITGSAILPHGGFGGLHPTLNIGNPMVAGLPSAHTCFNNLMLPPYDSMTDLHRKLVTAIYDGAEGFWIA
eukprot:m.800555 g.800555  ORF g.800555 m.800555 type:complete len:985 (+) comp23356_c1_seq2:189-3143(+)